MATKTRIHLTGLNILDIELGLRALASIHQEMIETTVIASDRLEESIRLQRVRALIEQIETLTIRNSAFIEGTERTV